MKKILKIFAIAAIILIISNISFARTPIQPKTTEIIEESLKQTEDLENQEDLEDSVINEDIYITGEDIIIENDVNGSVYIAAENVTVSSNFINGNIFIIAEEINITANIDGSAYLLANSVEFAGNVDDLYVITEDLNILETATCRGIKTISENIEVSGLIDRDLYAISNEIELKNTDKSKINGTLYCIGEVIGQTDKIKDIEKLNFNIKVEDKIINRIVEILKAMHFIAMEVTALLIISAIVIFTSKDRIEKVDIKEKFLKYTLEGLLYYILASIISILLIITILGIPFAFILLAIIILLFCLINLPLASIEIAKLILPKQEPKSKVLVVILAVLVFTLIQCLKLVPVIGKIIKTIISLYGFGIIINFVFKRKKAEPEVEIITENKE